MQKGCESQTALGYKVTATRAFVLSIIISSQKLYSNNKAYKVELSTAITEINDPRNGH